jgi:hypothetical protein
MTYDDSDLRFVNRLHVAQKWSRFWENDMLEKQRPKARRLNPFKRDALTLG